MSIFEKQSSTKVSIDDTYPLKPVIINTDKNCGHTEYIIRVQRGICSENAWHVHRRYNDFYALHKELSVAGVNLPLPPKKIIGNMDREFISQRVDGLQSYLNILLKNPILSNQKAVKQFLDPHNYGSLKELGITQISIKLRGELELKVMKQLPHIGRRLRKEHYFVVNNSTKEEFVLTWTPFGPDKYLDQKKISTILKSLCGLQHMNIASPIKAGVCVDGAWILRLSKKNGTLLDKLNGVKSPLTLPDLKKYSNYELRKPMESYEIIQIISQIIEAIAFLHHKGIPYGHLHLGNILYDDGVVRLLDVENHVLGLPPYYKEIIVKCRKIKSIYDVDIYCLGLLIYELVYGREYDFCDPKEFSSCPAILRPALDTLLTDDGSRNGLPEITHLLNFEIFQNQPPSLPPFLKLSTTSKQDLAISGNKTYQRFRDDHVKLRQYIRTTKLYEMFNEENGKLMLLYNTNKKCTSKSSSCDSDHPRSEISDGGVSSRTPTPSAASDGVAGCDENVVSPREGVEGRSALLGAICNFDKKHLKRVTSTN